MREQGGSLAARVCVWPGQCCQRDVLKVSYTKTDLWCSCPQQAPMLALAWEMALEVSCGTASRGLKAGQCYRLQPALQGQNGRHCAAP